jgi:hypothetical protein
MEAAHPRRSVPPPCKAGCHDNPEERAVIRHLFKGMPKLGWVWRVYLHRCSYVDLLVLAG